MLKNVPLPTKKRYLTVKERELHDLFQKIAIFWAVSVKQVATIVGPREHEYPLLSKIKFSQILLNIAFLYLCALNYNLSHFYVIIGQMAQKQGV